MSVSANASPAANLLNGDKAPPRCSQTTQSITVFATSPASPELSGDEQIVAADWPTSLFEASAERATPVSAGVSKGSASKCAGFSRALWQPKQRQKKQSRKTCGGGMLVPVINRIFRAVDGMKPEERLVKVPKGRPGYELGRQYYDLASIGLNPAGIAGLRKLFPTSQLLYGSDEPFGSTAQMATALPELGFSAEELQAIQRDNAARLLPRFQT